MSVTEVFILTVLFTSTSSYPETVHIQRFHSMEACEATKQIFSEKHSTCVKDKEFISPYTQPNR